MYRSEAINFINNHYVSSEWKVLTIIVVHVRTDKTEAFSLFLITAFLFPKKPN